ncbi:hypothetical protein JCM3766R1_002870 [Sporobolomyces carnicolor]
MIYARGGAAAGDASRNPSDTTYAAVPPSSTYRGPKVAGTYGGFVGVFVAVGVALLVVLTVLVLLRARTLRKRNNLMIEQDEVGGGGGGGGRRTRRDDDEEDDAFEMPRYERAGMESVLSFNDAGDYNVDHDGRDDGGREGGLYANEGISHDAFYDQDPERRQGRGTYDPFAETESHSGTASSPPRYDGPLPPPSSSSRSNDTKG